MIYFFDENKRYVGSRLLKDGEGLPNNATIIPVVLENGKQAHFVDGQWIISSVPIVEVVEQPIVEEVPLDVRVAKVEQEQDAIVDVLAEILGV